MELVYRRREKIVGLFLVITALLLVTTIAAIGRGKDWFRSYVHYYTVFHQAYNLDEKAPVKMAKANIGKVKKIELEGDLVRVDLAILSAYAPRIRQGSVTTVESPTLIGAEYVSIKPGDPKAPEIPPNGVIPSEAKKSVTDILNEFRVEETAKKVVLAVQELTEIIHQMHDQEGPLFKAIAKLDASLAHTESLLGSIERGEGTLGGAIRSDRLLVAIEANMAEIHAILRHTKEATALIPGTVGKVGGAVESIGGTANKAGGAVSQAHVDLAELQKVLEGVTKAMLQVNQILSNVEKASHDVPKLTDSTQRSMDDVRQSMREVDKVVRSVQQLPLIRSRVPAEPEAKSADADLRP
ncbi:MAG: MCE family protein [Deltaproteobacteria bacterium]|nr:MCE family protein [Deltaproteobacteria bacterium]